MKEPEFKIVKKFKKSELEKFASFFHQDWQMIFSTYEEGLEQYMESLDSSRKKQLKSELVRFLNDNSQASLLADWLKLGAQGWDTRLPLNETLKKLSEAL